MPGMIWLSKWERSWGEASAFSSQSSAMRFSRAQLSLSAWSGKRSAAVF